MLHMVVMGLAVLLLFEGIGFVTMPKVWQQLLRRFGEPSLKTLQRAGYSMIMVGGGALWLLLV